MPSLHSLLDLALFLEAHGLCLSDIHPSALKGNQ